MKGIYKAHSWESVVKRYRDASKRNKAVKPIADLAKRLSKSPYAQDIYPIASMFRIYLAQTPEFSMNREALSIDYDFKKQYFTLTFREHMDPNRKSWTQYCPPEEVYSGVVHFFRLQKWFTEFPDLQKTGNKRGRR